MKLAWASLGGLSWPPALILLLLRSSFWLCTTFGIFSLALVKDKSLRCVFAHTALWQWHCPGQRVTWGEGNERERGSSAPALQASWWSSTQSKPSRKRGRREKWVSTVGELWEGWEQQEPQNFLCVLTLYSHCNRLHQTSVGGSVCRTCPEWERSLMISGLLVKLPEWLCRHVLGCCHWHRPPG